MNRAIGYSGSELASRECQRPECGFTLSTILRALYYWFEPDSPRRGGFRPVFTRRSIESRRDHLPPLSQHGPAGPCRRVE